jgi:hypothetical protein
MSLFKFGYYILYIETALAFLRRFSKRHGLHLKKDKPKPSSGSMPLQLWLGFDLSLLILNPWPGLIGACS